MITPQVQDIGRVVVYRAYEGAAPEEGKIVFIASNGEPFVRYKIYESAKRTPREKLTWLSGTGR
jgi:hypothetical protein